MRDPNHEWMEFVRQTKAFVTVPVADWENVRAGLANAKERADRAEREVRALEFAIASDVGSLGEWQDEIDKAMRKGIVWARSKGIGDPCAPLGGICGDGDWGDLGKRLFPRGMP